MASAAKQLFIFFVRAESNTHLAVEILKVACILQNKQNRSIKMYHKLRCLVSICITIDKNYHNNITLLEVHLLLTESTQIKHLFGHNATNNNQVWSVWFQHLLAHKELRMDRTKLSMQHILTELGALSTTI